MGGHSCAATWELITGVDMTSPCSPVGELIDKYDKKNINSNGAHILLVHTRVPVRLVFLLY